MNTEAIFAALFDKLSAVPGVKTKSRKLKHWTDVSSSQQPALFQAQGSPSIQHAQGIAAKWSLTANIYLYVWTAGSTTPATQLNDLIDAIVAALAPDNHVKNTNTLGGLVHHCRIEGVIETDEGTLGDQAVAIIPVVILAT